MVTPDADQTGSAEGPEGQRGTGGSGTSPHWFERREQGFPIVPLTWQGRAATFLYGLLVVLAAFTYSQLTLTIFVIVFYTAAFVALVAYKSDLLEHWPPGP